jgi:hypothetical protein
MMDEWMTRGARAQSGVPDATLARADALVRDLLDELNRALLGGHGTLTAAPMGIAPSTYLWELWWVPGDGQERYVMVALLRDSRGTPYLKVQRRRLALGDALLRRRLRWALEDAFQQPWAAVSAEELVLRRLMT